MNRYPPPSTVEFCGQRYSFVESIKRSTKERKHALRCGRYGHKGQVLQMIMKIKSLSTTFHILLLNNPPYVIGGWVTLHIQSLNQFYLIISKYSAVDKLHWHIRFMIFCLRAKFSKGRNKKEGRFFQFLIRYIFSEQHHR